MGASGAGKSTFVKVLMGKAKATTGIISINGTPRNISDFKKIIGYVPQDDIVLPELTIRENLLHSARIRLPRTWKSEEIEKHVDTLIDCLHLSHVQDSLVGDIIKPIISGGQRKRVSIGIELVAAPMVLVLDEPTSGLDATSALSIIKLLNSLSSLGVTVICIIHQPRQEIFHSLDRVLLLARGRTIFFGETKDTADYFRGLGYCIPRDCNPADAVLDIISGDTERYMSNSLKTTPLTIEDLADNWSRCELEKTDLNRLGSDPATNPSVDLDALVRSASSRGVPRLRQAYYCLVRALTQQTRQVVGFLLEIVVGAIAGLMIGLSVYQLDGLLFQGIYRPPFELLSSSTNYTLVPELALLNSLAIGLAAAAPGVKTFGEEKTIYWREAASGHSRSAYFIGKILSTLFRIGLSSLHFTVFYALLATPIMPFGQLYLAHLLYFYCIYGLACAVSMVVSRQDGPLLAMIVSLIIAIFGGYGPNLSTVKSWHLEWIWRMCPGTWFSEAYFHSHTTPFSYLWDIEAAAEWTGYTLGQLSLDLGMLFVIGTVYRALAFTGLVFLNRDKQV
ncbi:ATP-binding cassette sub-family G member 2 [Polyplosphaeria fusca]|uniref:ATP-binding cassette sub-family G member 2 n=1 Tax=Polyplosphaeria fusca TaxID=682080 RepID=A0A9P4V1G9_9PLEO|nr:ATP-binding cassette sub-family G member 2 [Polyplosphaeria fusca]